MSLGAIAKIGGTILQARLRVRAGAHKSKVWCSWTRPAVNRKLLTGMAAAGAKMIVFTRLVQHSHDDQRQENERKRPHHVDEREDPVV